MKILFVIKDVEYIDPMGVMLLSALAKEKGHETELCVLADGKLKETIEKFKPDVAAFSAKTGEHRYYIAANDAVKKIDPNIFTVFGGPHVTFFPDIIMKYDIDALCVGEGDDAWPELLSQSQGRPPAGDNPEYCNKEELPARQTPKDARAKKITRRPALSRPRARLQADEAWPVPDEELYDKPGLSLQVHLLL